MFTWRIKKVGQSQKRGHKYKNGNNFRVLVIWLKFYSFSYTVSAVLTAALLLHLNFLGAVLKREFTYSIIFYFVCIYGSYSRAAIIKSAAVNTADMVMMVIQNNLKLGKQISDYYATLHWICSLFGKIILMYMCMWVGISPHHSINYNYVLPTTGSYNKMNPPK